MFTKRLFSVPQLAAAATASWLVLHVPGPVHADGFYWDGDGVAGGNGLDGADLGGPGDWDISSLLWWDGVSSDLVWPNTASSTAFFTGDYVTGAPAVSAIAVDSGIVANLLSFLRSGYVLSGGDITLDGVNPGFFVNLGESAIVSSQISGTDGLTLSGGGTLRLENTGNDYTGGTTLRHGALVITSQSALGAESSAIAVTGFHPAPGSTQLHSVGGGSLVLDGSGGSILISRNLSLQGQGPLSRQGAALASTGENTLSGTVDMGVAYSGTFLNTRILAADGTLNLTGTLNVLGTAGTTINSLGGVQQAGASFYNLTGILAGSGTLESSGGGTLFLNPSDASGFSGVVRVTGSAASGQSVVRIDSPGVLGTRISSGTSSVLDLNGGVLAVLMNAPSVQSGGVNAHVYGRDSSTIFADHTPHSSVKDQTVAFGSLTFEDNETFTFNSRNGYGMSFTTASVNGGDNDTTFTNNLQGGASLSFTGNFWSNANNTGNRTFTMGGNGNTLINGNIVASAGSYDHNFTKTGSGTLTITGTATTLDGTFNVNGGTMAVNDWRALNNNTGTINIGTSTTSATLSIVGNNVALSNLTTNKVINLAGTTGGATILANQGGTSPGLVLNAALTATGGSASNNKTLTLGGTNTAANTINGAIPNNAAGGLVNVTKIDSGTWVLAGQNAYTGATTISNGILKLQANAAPSTVIADTSAITFNQVNQYAGGTFEFVGQASENNVESLGALTPTLGAGIVKLTPGSGGTASLVFSGLGTVGDGSGLNIVGANASNTVTVSGLATGLASPRIYIGGSDFARSSAGVLVAPVYGTDATFVNAPAAASLPAGQSNFSIDGDISAQVSQIVSTLKFNGARTLTLGVGATLTVRTGANNTDGGILATGGSSLVTGGTSIQTGGSGTLTVRVDGATDTLTLETPINAGTGGLTKNGEGVLVFAATNAQTGTISINEGTIRLGSGGRLGGGGSSSTLSIRQGGVLDLNGVSDATSIDDFNNNGTVTSSSAGAVTLTVGNGNGGGTSFGTIEDGSGILSMVKLGTGAMTWNGLSTYTGSTTIGSTGVVTINNLQNGGSASGIGASGSAAANLVFNGASASQAFGGLSYAGTTNDETDRLFTFDGGVNGGARIQANGVNGATSTWSNTGALAFGSNAAGNPQGLVLGGSSTGDNRFFPVINDNGAAATSLYKADAGVWYLQAANSYTGATTLRGGALYANDGSSLPTASNLVFEGGSLATSGSFSRTVGTGAGQLQWTGYGSGGFSAGGSPLTVDFGSGNVWGSTPGFLGAGALLLNTSGVAKSDVDVVSGFEITAGASSSFTATTTADSSTVTLTSGTTAGLTAGQLITGNANIPAGRYIASITSATTFTLNSGTGVTVGTGVSTNASGDGYRQINVGDFTSIGADFATVSGVISGAGNLAKEGAGILNLRGANTYTGQTLVRQGTLVVESLGSSSLPGASSVGDSTLGHTDAGAIALGNGSTTAGILEYVGPGETSDRKIRLNTTTGNNQIHADGVGPLILTNVVNDMVAGNKLLYLRGVNSAGNRITSQLSDFGGTLGLTVDGGATWILTHAGNDFSGTTTAGGGGLGLGADTVLSSSTLSMTGGNIFAYGADRTLANAVSQGNNSTIGFVGDYSLTFTSPLALATSSNNATFVNSIVAGKTLSFGGATANNLTANRSWTFDGTGTTIFNGDLTTTTAFGLVLTKTGDGTLVLHGNTAPNYNKNNANIDLDRGVLKLGASGVIPDGAGFGAVVFTPELSSTDTATLDLNGQTETVNGLTMNSDGAAVIDNTSGSAASLTFGANDAAVSIGGGVGTYTITDSGAGPLSIFKTGSASTTIPTGVILTYQGTTGVTGGNFTIASPVDGTQALSVVNSGSTLALTGGIANPSAITSIVVENGGTLSLLDSAGSQINSLTNLQIGSSGGSMTTLNLNVGDGSIAGDELNTDLLRLLTGGTLSLFTGNQVTFNLTDAGLNPSQTYDLIQIPDGGLTSGVLGSSDWLLGASPGGFSSVILTADDDRIYISTGTLITGALYWRGLAGGGTDDTWNAGVSNWSENKDNSIVASTIPGQGTDVIFAVDSASGSLVTALEQNFKVNSLTFEAGSSTPGSVTINPGSVATNRIEVAPQLSSGGITISTGGPAAVTIGSSVKVGADQTWTVADAGTVLSLGSLRGEGDVSVSGSGKVVLTAAADPTFNSGGTSDLSISGATLEILDAAALGNTVNSNLATVAVGTGGAFYYNGAVNSAATGVANPLTLAGGTLSAGGNAGNNYYTGPVSVTAGSVINMRGSNSAVLTATHGNVVFSGSVSGSGKLTVDSINTLSGGNQNSGTFYLQNDNSGWSGGIHLLRGSVQSQNVNGLGTGDISASAGRVQFVTAGGTTHNLNQNITVDAPGGILELSADASGTPVSDLTVNLNGTITIGSASNANNALRFSQAGDHFSVFNISGPIVLGNNGSISYQGSSARPLVIPTIISDGGSGFSLAINDELGGWGVSSQTVRLTGLNTFSGNLSLNEGTLEFDTVSNAGGAASSLGQGSAITLGGATLRFIGASSQSTNRPVTTTGSPTLSANGSGGAIITYAGAISQGANQSLILTGTGSGVISGGVTQAAGSADITVNSGDWTFETGGVTVTDDFLINGGTVTLQNLSFGLNDDIVVSGSGTVLNLNSAGVWAPTNPAGTSSFLYARGGGVIHLNADDINGLANANATEGFLLADSTNPGSGTLNTNGFNVTIPRLDLGSIAVGYEGLVTGSGTVTATYAGTDYGQGFRLYRGSIAANLAGGSPMIKQGLGEVTLSGNNSGLTGSVAAPTRIDSGNLVLDYSASNTAKLPGNQGLDLRGGRLTIAGSNSGATSQTVASLTLGNGGSSSIQVNAGSGQEAVLNLGAITRANGSQDGTIRFYLPTGSQSNSNGITTSSPNSTFGLLGTGGSSTANAAYATIDDGTGVWFATSSGGNIVALASTAKDDVTTWTAGDHVTDLAGFGGGVLNCTSINSLRFDAASGSQLMVAAGSALSIASGGILVTSQVGGTPSITGGTLASGTQELVIHQESGQPFGVGSAIRGSYAVTKTGSGILLLSGTNVYTDETEIQEGILRVGGGNAIGDTSLVTLSDDHASGLELLADETIGRLQGGSASSGLDSLAVVDIGSNRLTINQTGNSTYAGLLTGTGSILKTGSGQLQLTNVSSGFSGILTVDSGLLYLSGLGQINASMIRVNKGGTLLIDNNGTTRSATRILDTTPVTLNSADGTFAASAIVRGLFIRTDQNAVTNETIGTLNFASGANYLSGEASGSTGRAAMIADDFVRLNNATVNARARNMGLTSGDRNNFRIGTPGNESAFVASLVGGGGAAGAQNISILPWGVGEQLSGSLSDANMGNSLLTYELDNGFRALSFATEYDTLAGAAAADNARESLSGDLSGLSGTTVNALVLHNASSSVSSWTVGGSGAGQELTVTSGALLFTLNPAATSGSYGISLGGFDNGIAVGSTNEYVFHVVNPSSAAGSASLTATISSPLSSNADITKSGRGTLILSGSNTAGGGANKVTLNEGILEISSLSNVGGAAGGLVFAGGTLRFGAGLTDDISQRSITILQGGATIDTNGVDLALANSLGAGTGGFTKTGSGNLTLQAAATYTGTTIISSGTLTAGANNATGSGGDLVVNAGAILDLGSSSLSHALVTASGADPVFSGSGTITASTGFFFDHDGGTDLVTVDAVLAGASGLLKANRASNLTLTGLNTFTGGVEVLQGTLSFNTIQNVGGGASALGAPATLEDGMIRMGFTTGASTLIYTGTGHSTDRIIALQGTTGGVSIHSSGTGALVLDTVKGINPGTKTLTLDGSATGFDNEIALIDECLATLNLTKTGSSSWLLTGVNSYSGVTNVDNGNLKIGVTNALPTTTAVRIGSGSTAGTLDLNGYDQTIGSLTSQSTSNAVANSILVSPGNTLTINGAVTLGANADNSNTAVTASGGGAIVVNSGGANFQVGGATGGTNDNRTTADFSGLSSFTANLGAGSFRVGDANSGTENNVSTFRLATDNTISAASVRIGDGSGGSFTHTLTLGSGTNLIHADTINVGSAGSLIRSGGALVFDAGDTSGTVTIRGSDGISRSVLNMVNTTGNTAGHMSSTIDFTGHGADLLISTLTMASRTAGTGNASATLSFDQGTLDVTALNMASRTSTGTGGADATLNMGGGTATIGAVNLAVNTSSGGAVIADLNVTGGSITLGPVNMANAGTGRTVTSTVDLTGGTIEVTGSISRTGGAGTENTTVTLNGAALDMNGNSIGTAAAPVAFAAQSGSLSGLSELNQGGSLEKASAGVLVLNDGNTYTGGTTVTDGTLLANNTLGSATGTGNVSVTGGTLGGSGSITGDTVISSTATLTAGTAGAVDTLAFGGNLTVSAGSTWLVDFVNGMADFIDIQSGLVTLAGDINIVDDGTWVPNATYQIAHFGSRAGTFANALNSGDRVGDFYIFYGSDSGEDFITLQAIPEPEAWLPAVLVLGCGLFLSRRRSRFKRSQDPS